MARRLALPESAFKPVPCSDSPDCMCADHRQSRADLSALPYPRGRCKQCRGSVVADALDASGLCDGCQVQGDLLSLLPAPRKSTRGRRKP